MKSKLLVLLMLCTFGVFAQQLPFQGNLLINGEAFTGPANFQFSIPSASWSETINDVNVRDGFYSITLGMINPIPDGLFATSNQAQLNVTVNGETLSPATLYAPFISPNLKGTNFTTYAANGSKNIELSVNGAPELGWGGIHLYDDADRITAQLVARNTGGGLLLRQANTDNSALLSYINIGQAQVGNSQFLLHGMNPSGTGNSRLIHAYSSSKTYGYFGAAPDFSNGYRRGALELMDNEGRLLANLTIFRNESGADPAGTSGLLSLRGTSTLNVELGSRSGEDHNFGSLQICGNNDNGAGGTAPNFLLETIPASGKSYAKLGMANTQNGGSRIETIWFTSAEGSGGGANAVIANASGSPTVTIDGGSGHLSAQTLQSTNGTVQSSDARLKKDVQPLSDVLANTRKLRGVSYYWKDESMPAKQIGFIAQELEAIYPEFVHTSADGMKAVNYAQLTAVLLEAIKELDAQVLTLKVENAQLTELKAEVELIRKMLGTGNAANQ